MGKVRRNRTKYHFSAKCNEGEVNDSEQGGLQPQFSVLQLPPLSTNPFSQISIAASSLDLQGNSGSNSGIKENETLESSLPEKLEQISSGTKSVLHLKKKEKRKLKREQFLQKLEVTRRTQEKKKEAKKRSEIPVVGDLKPMTLALGDITRIISTESNDKVVDSNTLSIDEVKKISIKKKRRRKPKWVKEKMKNVDPLEKFKNIDDSCMKKIQSKRTQKHMLYEIHKFQELVSGPTFQNTSMQFLKAKNKNAEINNNK